GALMLRRTLDYFPARIHLAVVDPEVGAERRAIAVRTLDEDRVFVGPDNGVLSIAVRRFGGAAEAFDVSASPFRRQPTSSTFHGRDIFAPVSGRLARGDDWTGVGPAIDPKTLVRLDLAPPKVGPDGVRARAIGTDGPYGNLILDLSAEAFAGLGWRLGETVPLTVAGRPEPAPYVRTFSDVPEGAVLLYPDSRGRMSLALNMGNYAAARGVGPGAEVFIPRRIS
ncbi:MAG: S-adenosyl-l-methionine hydroxide adenosyltransferase family protein, partial [Phenylobacterium sp.]